MLCQNGGTCVDGVNSFTCTCVPGFKGRYCAQIDACANDPCENGATCIATVDSYVCECAAGFRGARCQTTVGYCTPGLRCHHGTCAYDGSGITCRCWAGFEGSTCRLGKSQNQKWVGDHKYTISKFQQQKIYTC